MTLAAVRLCNSQRFECKLSALCRWKTAMPQHTSSILIRLMVPGSQGHEQQRTRSGAVQTHFVWIQVGELMNEASCMANNQIHVGWQDCAEPGTWRWRLRRERLGSTQRLAQLPASQLSLTATHNYTTTDSQVPHGHPWSWLFCLAILAGGMNAGTSSAK
jgi:hypothetical protein